MILSPAHLLTNGERLYEAEYRGIRWLAHRGFVPRVLPLAFPATDISPKGFHFLDGSGQLWAVRWDFTPSVVRALARELERAEAPVQVCYAGEVARPSEARLTGVAEFFQLGFESINVEGQALETTNLLLGLVQHLGLAPENSVLVVGCTGVAEAILCQLLEDAPEPELFELLIAKDVAALNQRLGLSGEAANQLRQAVWGESTEWVRYFGQEKAWDHFCELRRCAEEMGVRARFEVAPKLEGSYYCGTVFALWGRRTKSLLATGGEYRVPVGTRHLPAVGCTLSLNRVLEEVEC